MNSPIHFNTKDRPEFFQALRKNVNAYFQQHNISRQANFNMVFKTGFMICLYFIPLGFLLSGVVTTTWVMFLLWGIMGLGMTGLGLAVTHDANHHAYSRNKHVNNGLGFMLNFIGGYHINWKIQHNMLHHSYTNIDGHDEDIVTPVMRFSPNQVKKKMYRFQAYYASFFYAIMSLYWLVYRDFSLLSRYSKRDFLSKFKLTKSTGLLQILANKLGYIGLLLVLPILFVSLPWWQVVLGFLLMHFISGLFLALIFQTAHIVEETDFFISNEAGSMENNWAIHQMKTTANYAPKSIFFSWFIGGLNFQIEHHLFPNICHVHYKKISAIVQETAREFGVPYHQFPTFLGALKSHFSLLNRLGNG